MIGAWGEGLGFKGEGVGVRAWRPVGRRVRR